MIALQKAQCPTNQQWPGWQLPVPDVVDISTDHLYTIPSNSGIERIPLLPTSKATCTHVNCSVQWLWEKMACITSGWKHLKVSVQILIFPPSCYSDYWVSRWQSLNQPGSLMQKPQIMGDWHVIWKRKEGLLYFCHWDLGNFCFHRLNQAYQD